MAEVRPALAFVVVIAIALIMFFLGTVVGFSVAYKELTACTPTPCEKLGVDAQRCEVCKADAGVAILWSAEGKG